MRVRRLYLIAVGPFTDVSLDFSGERSGLHIIFGPNEAGKTSALRAVSYLLFGFPRQNVGDDFLHEYSRLRVGGTLEGSDGTLLEVIRRKRDKDSLRGADDETVVPEEALQRLLGGLDRTTFENLFGIDHVRLRRAGEEIREGKGQLGEILFAAGAGLSGLRAAQRRLQERLGELYKSRAQNPRINAGLAEYKKASEALKRNQLPDEQWRQHDEALRSAKARQTELDEKLSAIHRRGQRLRRSLEAIPQTQRFERLREELSRLGDAPTLRDDFAQDARLARESLQAALLTRDQARGAIARLDDQLASLADVQPLLDHAEAIENLQERLGAIEKAAIDRGRVDNLRLADEHTVRRLLRSLGHAPDVADAEILELRADEPVAIRALGQKFASLTTRVEDARKAIDRHNAQIARIDRDRVEGKPPADLDALRRTVERTRRAGDLDDFVAKSRSVLARAEKEARAARARLPGWDRDDETLRELPVPLDATVISFEHEMRTICEKVQVIENQVREQSAECRKLESQLAAIDQGGDVLTEDDLDEARRTRDRGWQLVRSAWLEAGTIDPSETAAFIAGQAPGGTLADAFDRSMNHADRLADRLRLEAGRLSLRANLLSRLEAARGQLEATQLTREALVTQQQEWETRWHAVISPLGLSGIRPAELRDWLRTRAEVLRVLDILDATQQECRANESAREAHRHGLIAALADLGQPAGAVSEDLNPALDRAEDFLRQNDEANQQRSAQEAQRADAIAERDLAQQALHEAEQALETWRVEWSRWMERIGLEPGATPEQAEAILGKLQELHETNVKLKGHRSRINGIDRDAEQFAADVRDWARRLLPDFTAAPTNEMARALARALREARAVEERRRSLIAQREAEALRLAEAEDAYQRAKRQLEALCQEAGCDCPDALFEASRRSSERIRVQADLREVEGELLRLAMGANLDDFVREIQHSDADALATEIDRLDAEARDLNDELARVHQMIGAEQGELARMNGGALGAEAAETVQSLLARLQADVGRFAALKLADAILRRGIEQYRERHAGPILNRAGELFAALTDGSFAGLTIDEDNDGRTSLLGVRPEKQSVHLNAMSDGAHDQLYLALRLASLEAWLTVHEPIPLILDDVLLNFDDRRAAAALRLLAEFSRKTQVFFFTHHQHLVDLAKQTLPIDNVTIHELSAPRATAGSAIRP